MTSYKTYRIVDGKPRLVIVDENGQIINKNTSKDKLKGLEKEPRKYRDTIKKYTDEDLLGYLRQFEKENGRIPTIRDFINSPEYPVHGTYQNRFGSWSNALKLVGLDAESMVKHGIVKNNYQKGRLSEIIVRDHFKKNPVDLAGENCISPWDGLCPNGLSYDVKSSKFHKEGHYKFSTKNKYKEDIEIYYLLAFNEDYTELEHGWRIPGEMAEKDHFQVGLNSNYEFNVENMKEYDITDKLREIINRGEYLNMTNINVRIDGQPIAFPGQLTAYDSGSTYTERTIVAIDTREITTANPNPTTDTFYGNLATGALPMGEIPSANNTIQYVTVGTSLNPQQYQNQNVQ
jgi:hypothetical protein